MKIRSLINLIISILFVLGINYYFFESNDLGNRSIFNILLLICCMFLLESNKKDHLKEMKPDFIFSLLLAFSLIFGRIINSYNDLLSLFCNLKELIYFWIMLIGFTLIFTNIFHLIFKKLNKGLEKRKLWKIFTKKYSILVMWLLIFISWLPAYLAYYPGILSYDADVQTLEAQGIASYTQFHPPLHTFIWQICLNIGNTIHIEPLVIYSISQMLFLSFVLSRVIKNLIDKKTNNYIILLTFLFFTINPVLAIFSFCVTKDIYFAAFFILFILEIIKLFSNFENYLKDKKNYFIFLLIVLFMCLFRNNAIYAYFIFSIIVIFYFKKYLKKILLLLSMPLIIYILVVKCFYPLMGIKDGASSEFLSVPIQQISRIVYLKNKELDEDTKVKIDNYFSYGNAFVKYNPRIADRVKHTFNSQYFDSNKLEFFRLWFDLFNKYPFDYFYAFFTLNLPYWYIDASTVDSTSQVKYIETGIYNNELYQTKRTSVFPALLKIYSKVDNFSFASNNPLVVNIFSITTPFWIMLFTVFVLISKDEYQKIFIVLPGLLLWLTYMFGPVSNFRYIFPIFIQYPLFVSLWFSKKIIKR